MSSKQDSTKKTLTVALVLCLVCSVMVSVAAVGLKPMQDANKALDRNKNVLSAAGLLQPGQGRADIQRLFDQFELRLVNLPEGRFATDDELREAGIDPRNYNDRAASRNPALSRSLRGDDPAGIQRQARFVTVYLRQNDSGQTDLLVLPINGAGLWGAMYGFLVLEGDLRTVRGLSFYEHKETPGLGAKVENEDWRAQWPGQSAFNEDGSVAVTVVKSKASAPGEIDGLSGATLTTKGVDNMVRFWLGEQGYGPFIAHLQAGKG
ncbi:MAG: Na(+)-translocating NADH-quinone reductase subunit C [Burkholderiales bacterium]|nr:MAG: Na(+)-translocating NADH-quinone reductase subunit C [Burkholderiales bacterium]